MTSLSELQKNNVEFNFDDQEENNIKLSDLEKNNINFSVSDSKQKPSRFKNVGFTERLKASFGDRKAKQRQQDLEKQKGLKGKLDIGDIADVIGGVLPLAGGIAGAFAGPLGPAVGTTAGESTRRTVGSLLGQRKETTPIKEVTGPLLFGAAEFVGGKAIKGAGKLIKGTGKFAVDRIPKLLGIMSGESDDVVRAALRDPTGANKALINGDEALRKVVEEASDKSIKLRTGFINGFSETMNQFKKTLPKEIKYNEKDVISSFKEVLEKKNIKFPVDKFGNTKLDFSISDVISNNGEVGAINKTFNALNNWNDFSFDGTVQLKRLVQNLTKFADDSGVPAKSPTLSKFQNEINNLIKSKLPNKDKKAYESINQKFSSNIKMFDDVVDAFNRGDPFTKIAGVFSKNKDKLRQVVNFFEDQTGDSVSSIVAGRELAAEKSAAFGFLNPRSWIDFIFPPRSQAKVVTSLGKVLPKEKRKKFEKELFVFPKSIKKEIPKKNVK